MDVHLKFCQQPIAIGRKLCNFRSFCYVYGSKLRNTWLETYEPIWSFFLKIFNFRNVTTFRHSNLERKRPDDEFDTILPDQETERIAKFRATHGPTMV